MCLSNACVTSGLITYHAVAVRDIKELHRHAANELRVDSKAHAEMENLLNELEQLLVGIAIMQVGMTAHGAQMQTQFA